MSTPSTTTRRDDAPGVRARIVRGGALLATGHVGARLLSLARLVILTRLLGPAEFGLASLLILTVLMLEMASNLSFDKAIIRESESRSISLQASAHTLSVLRGMLIAGVLVALAGPLAAWLSVPEAAPMIRWLALAPLAAGFLHLDTKRVQRSLSYKPDVSVELIAQIITTAAAWPVAHWAGNASAAVWLVVGRNVVHTICSHALARTPYRWSLDRGIARELVVFGSPLIANGVLFFAIMQGDQLVVGKVFGLAELGVYAAVFGLVSAPTLILAKVSVSLLLPVYSRAREDRQAFDRAHRLSSRCLALAAIALMGGFISLGTAAVSLVYGERYSPGLGLVAALAVMQGIRILRIAPTIAAIAHGDTANAMFANIFRVSTLPVAIALAVTGSPIVTIALCGVAGELVAFAFTSRRLSARGELTSDVDTGAISVAMLAVIAVFTSAAVGEAILPLIGSYALACSALAIALALCLVRWAELRRELIRALSGLAPGRQHTPTRISQKGACT